jgi:hypothetical protein
MINKSKQILICITAFSAMTMPRASATVVVNFYSDQSDFAAAAGALTLQNFEGIVADNAVADYGTHVTFGAVDYSAVGDNHLDVVGKDAAFGGTGYYSAIMADGNLHAIVASVGGGAFAVGANVGYLYGAYNQDEGINLKLTLNGTSGLLDSRTVQLFGICCGGPPQGFAGYVVSGDEIQSIEFDTTFGGAAIDNFQYSTESGSAPEPTTSVLFATALAGIGIRRRRAA